MSRKSKQQAEAEAAAEEKITPDQIRSQLQAVSGGVNDTAAEFRQKAIAAGAILAAIILILVFLVGRSKGKKRTTVVEVIRV